MLPWSDVGSFCDMSVPQLFGQHHSGATEVGVHGALGAVQDRRDLWCRAVAGEVQGDDHPLPSRQGVHDRPERNDIRRRTLRNGFLAAQSIDEQPLGATSPQSRSAGVEQHAMAPRPRPLQPTDATPLHEGLDHRVLNEVLAIAKIARDRPCHRDETRVLDAVEVLEPSVVTVTKSIGE